MTEELEVVNEQKIKYEIEKLDKQLEQMELEREIAKIKEHLDVANKKLARLEEIIGGVVK